MLRKIILCSLLAVTLATLPGCIIHDPGYYPNERVYSYDPYYPYYYAPYYFTPFWFSGSFFFGDFDRGGHSGRGHRGSGGHEGRGGGRR